MITPAQIHLGDIGTIFEATVKDQDGVVIDISSATTKTLIFKKPDSTVVTKTAAFSTTGTDGKMRYVTLTAADLNETGQWEVQGHLILASGDWHTSTESFVVLGNLG